MSSSLLSTFSGLLLQGKRVGDEADDGNRQNIGQLFDMIGSRLLTELDEAQKWVLEACGKLLALVHFL